MLVDWGSRFLALVVNTVGAEIGPVGGGLGGIAALTGRLDALVRARILRPTNRALVVPARYPADAALLGAALLHGGSVDGEGKVRAKSKAP